MCRAPRLRAEKAKRASHVLRVSSACQVRVSVALESSAPGSSALALVIAPASEKEAHAATAPLAVWLLIQLGVLALIVARVPLAAQFPIASERLAPRFVLGAQVVAGALLFPFLLRDIRIAAQIILSAIPFQLAAGYFAGINLRAMIWPALFVEGWLLTLTLWALWI